MEISTGNTTPAPTGAINLHHNLKKKRNVLQNKKRPNTLVRSFTRWCRGRDLNPHEFHSLASETSASAIPPPLLSIRYYYIVFSKFYQLFLYVNHIFLILQLVLYQFCFYCYFYEIMYTILCHINIFFRSY